MEPGGHWDIACEGLVGCWREPPYVYLFLDRWAAEPIVACLEAKGAKVTGHYEISYAQWQKIPGRIFLVGPFRIVFDPAEKESVPDCHKTIVLNPGLVFGLGVHPTTRLCLKLLGKVFVPNLMETVVDLGTGTGILALAAARLGARRVLALDVNPLAAQEAAGNIRRNRLQRRIFPIAAENLDAVGGFGTLLLMNLEWPSLFSVFQSPGWRRFRWVLCSGYLEGQTRTVQDVMSPTHIMEADMQMEGWVASFWGRRS